MIISLVGEIYYGSYYKTRCWSTPFSYEYKIFEFFYKVLIISITSIAQAFPNEESQTIRLVGTCENHLVLIPVPQWFA